MIEQLPALSAKTKIAVARILSVVPLLIADAGEQASWRYVEFFTANIRNANTRRAYARACGSFLAWREERGLTLIQIRPHDVASYIEVLQANAAAPSVKLPKEHANTAMPTKKPKKKLLTKEQKRANREQSRERIPVENVIGCIKRFRILSERYRCHRKRFGLRINLISGIYNYEIDHASDNLNPVSK